MKSLIPASSCLLAIVILGACSAKGPTLPETDVEAELPPMDLPTYTLGQKREYTDELTGEKKSWTVTEVRDDGGISALMSNGCKWTQAGAWFDGDGSWEDCGKGDWSAGTREPESDAKSLWPLRDGASAKYRYKLTNKVGEVQTVRRRCDVNSVNVTTSAGPVDAYKVVCSDTNVHGPVDVRTWYFSPEYGEIRYSRWKPNGGMRSANNYL